MPLYVYACDTCEVEVEELRPAGRADEPVPCPVCQQPCSRALTTFSLGGRTDTGQDGSMASAASASFSHTAGCGCCVPRPRR